ncbi:DNA-packaging protein [Arsenophonus sp.]|uniref:DNA-packaging protein n=1 Tax=Arsenophonus sp. TaxID=1872640 RepID=UPI00387A529D
MYGGYELVGDVIPSLAGLACYLGIARSTLYEYQKINLEFSDILEAILSLQENKLINKGLIGDFNASVTKLILTKHGYSDKQEIEHSGELGLIDLIYAARKRARGD